jgi:hypothetical protein
METGGKLFNHALVLSFREKGSILSLMASSEAPFILKVMHFSKKLERCKCGSSSACPQKVAAFWSIWIKWCRHSKLFRSIPGGFIAAPKLSMLGRKKSINVLSSAIGQSAVIAVATSRARARSLSRKKRSGSGIAGTSNSAGVELIHYLQKHKNFRFLICPGSRHDPCESDTTRVGYRDFIYIFFVFPDTFPRLVLIRHDSCAVWKILIVFIYINYNNTI